MGFANIAKQLILTETPKPAAAGVVAELERAGFSREEIFQEMRNIVDDTEANAGVKKGVLELAAKLHGLLHDNTEVKVAPTFILKITGGGTTEQSNTKLNTMLNPALEVTEVIN